MGADANEHEDHGKPKAATSAEKRAPASDAHQEGGAREPTLPAPALPKGGGAIAPIGEKLVPNPQMGTASFSAPVFTSPGRGGFGPKLDLSYDAGAGNGPYGLGWSLSLAQIARKTDKGLPLYDDAHESDVFVLSGAEDLVPIETFPRGGEVVHRYRPRVDAQFARIERRVRADGSSYWVSWTRDNIRSVYGFSAQAQVADPAQPRLHVFRWLLEWSDDDKGNCVAYTYKPEDATGVAAAPFEDGRAHTNTYLKSIAYGLATPRATRATAPLDLGGGRAAAVADWPLVVLFDYGDHDAKAPTLAETPWPARLDAFSTYRAGFEIRTHRLCRRILMLHRFGDAATHAVVRSTELDHVQTGALSYLRTVTQVGWTTPTDKRPMPAIVFGYGEISALSDRVRVLDDVSAQNLPRLDGSRYALIDYDGEGLPGVLTEQAGRGWFYKRPEGRDGSGAGRFGPMRALDPRPSVALDEGFQLQDINGDGVVDLVRVRSAPRGVFERERDGWAPFRAFPDVVNIDWADPNLKFCDLDGDGFPDVLITGDEVVRWHPAVRRDGYGEEAQLRKPHDRSEPMPLFATKREAVLLADMTGDGLSDVVHVRNGSVTYWPNLGYGRFGARVRMAGTTRLAGPDGFDPKRVRLADIDGTGAADLLYLGGDGVRVWLNQSGNTMRPAGSIGTLPPVDALTDFQVTDLWGTGTSCLVWSTPLTSGGRTLRWIDLLEGKKPHLLETVDNGFGLRTTIAHAPSTRYYLADRAVGLPWVTRLPMPIQVVASVTVEDLVAETRLATTFQYHHGFYDGLEREFRGFARVDQDDSESVAAFAGKSEYPRGLDATLDLVPTRTRTWYHTGAFLDGLALSRQLAREYFNDGIAPLADSTIVGTLTPSERREAWRALRGKPLRQEITALDGDDRPYLVTEHNYMVRVEHNRGGRRHAAFSVHARETLTHHLERRLGDARVNHEAVLVVGAHGEVREKVALAYPRGNVPARRAEQLRLWATHTLATTTPDHDAHDEDYRVAVPFETLTSELGGLPATHVLTFDEIVAGAGAPAQPWVRPELRLGAGRWLAQRTQVRYWDDTATTELAAGASGVRALPSRTLTLALTRALLHDVFDARVSGADALAAAAGYLVDGDDFWAYPGLMRYDAAHFFLATSLENPFHGVSSVSYAADYLLPMTTQDAFANVTHIGNDFRLLAPAAITDPNGTTTSVTTDALGVVVATAVRGPSGEGGTLSESDYTFGSAATPTQVHVRTYQTFAGDGAVEETWIYGDASGREIQKKQLTTPGPEEVEVPASPTLSPRYVATGRTVFNNKGKPVKKYEPYFSGTSDFDHEAALATRGVTPVLQYDALGRVVRTDLPNGTYTKVVFEAWSREAWDENDTLEASTPWVVERSGGAYAREPQYEKRAADDALLRLAQTPTTQHLDALGRSVAVVADAGATDALRLHETSQALDVLGQVLTTTDASGLAVARHRFDSAGRRLLVESVDAGKTWTLPDALGAPRYLWRADRGDAEGLRLRHDYDFGPRLVGVWEQPESGSEVLRERVVYLDSGAAPPYGVGRVNAELDGAGLLQHSYDFRGRVARTMRQVLGDARAQGDWTSAAAWIGGAPPAALDATHAYATEHDYDAVGRETARRAFVDANLRGDVRTTYNIAGQLSAISDFVTSVSYDAKGRRHQIVFGHGAATTYGYDPLSFRLDSLETRKGGTLFQQLSYVYDAAGHITAVRDAAQDVVYFGGNAIKPVREYTYDALYRLRVAVGREHLSQSQPDERDVPVPLPLADPNDLAQLAQFIERYTYDPSGNISEMSRPTQWTRSYTRVAGSNRLAQTTVGGFTSPYVHDRRGNMTSMAHLDSMTWTHRDQLARATRTRRGNTMDPSAAAAGSAPVYFGYDLRGQRVRKLAVTANRVTDRVYLGGFEIYSESPTLGAPPTLVRETLHILDGEQRVALVETRTDAVEPVLIRYQHGDHLGSAVAELDDNAAPISYEEFHPYGSSALYAGLASKRYRFTGMERDDETGLQSHGVRCYAGWLARWISADPAGTDGGLNLFAYSRNNPVILSDRGGRDPAVTPHPAAPRDNNDNPHIDRTAQRRPADDHQDDGSRSTGAAQLQNLTGGNTSGGATTQRAGEITLASGLSYGGDPPALTGAGTVLVHGRHSLFRNSEYGIMIGRGLFSAGPGATDAPHLLAGTLHIGNDNIGLYTVLGVVRDPISGQYSLIGSGNIAGTFRLGGEHAPQLYPNLIVSGQGGGAQVAGAPVRDFLSVTALLGITHTPTRAGPNNTRVDGPHSAGAEIFATLNAGHGAGGARTSGTFTALGFYTFAVGSEILGVAAGVSYETGGGGATGFVRFGYGVDRPTPTDFPSVDRSFQLPGGI